MTSFLGTSTERYKGKEILLTILTLLMAFFSYFLLVYYPIVGDGFDYQHQAIFIYTEKAGFIEPDHVNAGYYVLTVIISEIAGISYDVIQTSPLQSVALIFLLVILRECNEFC